MKFTDKLGALKARKFDLKNRRWINASGRPVTILSEQTASGAEVLERLEMARREIREFQEVEAALAAMLDEAARDFDEAVGASLRPNLDHEQAKHTRALRRPDVERCGHASEIHKGATCIKRPGHLGAHQWRYKS